MRRISIVDPELVRRVLAAAKKEHRRPATDPENLGGASGISEADECTPGRRASEGSDAAIRM